MVDGVPLAITDDCVTPIADLVVGLLDAFEGGCDEDCRRSGLCLAGLCTFCLFG